MCMCGKCSGQTSHSVYKYSDNCSWKLDQSASWMGTIKCYYCGELIQDESEYKEKLDKELTQIKEKC